MKDGSVVVDLAAEQGGNCELTVPGEVAVRHGVSIIGYTDLPSRLAAQSSQLYAMNLRHLLFDMTPGKDGELVLDLEDEVVRGATVVTKVARRSGRHLHRNSRGARRRRSPNRAPVVEEKKPSVLGTDGHGRCRRPCAAGPRCRRAASTFMAHFTVFVLACFVGYMVIWNVTPALHTPLMSVTNAISSIIVIGALLQVSSTNSLIMWIAVLTVLITSINIAGGFAVTRRMLDMFRK